MIKIEHKKNIPFEMNTTSVYNVHDLNSSFAEGTLDVMYTGENRNGSFFEEADVRNAFSSLYNVPIVAHWMPEDNTIGGHDMEIHKDGDGIKINVLTEPCGVVPEHATFSFKKKKDANGDEHNYLVIDNVLLWKRQDVYDHIVNDLDGVVKHSMEVNVKDAFDGDDGFYHITDFEFTALCLLENCEPCFEDSKLTLFSTDNFKKRMADMIHDLEETNYELTHPGCKTETCSIDQPRGGEQLKEKEKQALAEKYSIDLDSLDFDADELSMEELEERFKEIEQDAKEKEFELETVLRKELRMAVAGIEVIHDNWGDYPKYCFEDYDANANEVYVRDCAEWTLYGFNYTTSGDAVIIDANSKKRKKYVISDFNDGEAQPEPQELNPIFELTQRLSEIYKNNAELLDVKEKYEELKEEAAQTAEKIAELQAYKDKSEKDIAEAERKVVLDEFADLKDVEEFVALSENCSELTPDELKEKCFAIRGRNIQVNFSLEQNPSTRISVSHTEEDEEEPYGGLFKRYGIE